MTRADGWMVLQDIEGAREAVVRTRELDAHIKRITAQLEDGLTIMNLDKLRSALRDAAQHAIDTPLVHHAQLVCEEVPRELAALSCISVIATIFESLLLICQVPRELAALSCISVIAAIFELLLLICQVPRELAALSLALQTGGQVRLPFLIKLPSRSPTDR